MSHSTVRPWWVGVGPRPKSVAGTCLRKTQGLKFIMCPRLDENNYSMSDDCWILQFADGVGDESCNYVETVNGWVIVA